VERSRKWRLLRFEALGRGNAREGCNDKGGTRTPRAFSRIAAEACHETAGEWCECRSAAMGVGLVCAVCCVLRQVQDVAFKVDRAGGCDRSVAQIPRARSVDTRCLCQRACCWRLLFCKVFLDLLPALCVCGFSLASAIDDGQARHSSIPSLTSPQRSAGPRSYAP
jgi:hypothetical protein